MKTLYLLRHAEAVPQAPAPLGDHERALTAVGEKAAARVADYIGERAVVPEFILSSSSVRTLQTARIIMGDFMKREGARVQSCFDRKLYLATADTLLTDIQAVNDEYERILVVGHNPGIADLAMALSKSSFSDFSQDFGTATLAVFEGDFHSWHALETGHLRLTDVFAP